MAGSKPRLSHKVSGLCEETEEQWKILVEHVPEGIQIKSPVHYDIYSETKVEEFRNIVQKYSIQES